MDLHAYGSSDKQHFLCRMADCWLPKDKRICWACWRFQAFGEGSKAMWLHMAAEKTDTAEHTQRAMAWERNWEVKNWFNEESDEIYNFSSDDERLRCPGCVMKGFRITVSKSFVYRRNRERENREWLKEIMEKDKKDEEDKLAADAKAKDIAICKAAQVAYKDGSVTKRLKRKGDMKAEGCALKVKRQKEGTDACALAVNKQRTILLPKRPHLFDALCGCARCDAELEGLSKKPAGMFDVACA